MAHEPIVKAVLSDPVVKAVVANHAEATPTIGERGQTVAAPTSTEEQDRVSAGQRDINRIWETTQMKIALSVIWSSIFAGTALAVFGKWLGSNEMQLASIVFLYGVANLVTGFYFGRTNHQKIGGVEQQGR